ncbi:MAG: hypothetical protein ACJAQT_000024 [Akkermansiaceae bacterium]|jgi:hypothetical protein
MSAIVHYLTDPDSAEMVDIDTGRAQHHRLGGKEAGFQALPHIEAREGFSGGHFRESRTDEKEAGTEAAGISEEGTLSIVFHGGKLIKRAFVRNAVSCGNLSFDVMWAGVGPFSGGKIPTAS